MDVLHFDSLGAPPTQIQKDAYALKKEISAKAKRLLEEKEIIARAKKLQREKEIARKKESEKQRVIAAKKQEAYKNNQENKDKKTTAYTIGKILRYFYDINQAKNKQQAANSPGNQSFDSEYINCYNEVAENRIATCNASVGSCDSVGCSVNVDCDKGFSGHACQFSIGANQWNSGFYYCDIEDKWNYNEDIKVVVDKICLDN